MVPEQDGDSRLTTNVNALHYMEVEDREMRIKRHIRGPNENAERERHDWRDEAGRDAKLQMLCINLWI